MKLLRRLALAAALLLPSAAPGVLQARELQAAIRAGDLEQVKALLAADPQRLHRQIEFHSYPLLVAVSEFKPDIIRLLLEQGAKINDLDAEQENVLFRLVRVEFTPKQHDDMREVMRLLLERQANAAQVNAQGQTPLHVLASRQLGKSTIPLKLELMKALIAKGGLPKKDKAPVPLLLEAMRELKRESTPNAVATVKFLVEQGAGVNATSAKGNTALHRVIATEVFSPEQKADLVAFLVEHGADTRQKNDSRESPLDLVPDRHDPLYAILRRKPPKP